MPQLPNGMWVPDGVVAAHRPQAGPMSERERQDLITRLERQERDLRQRAKKIRRKRERDARKRQRESK